MRLMDPATVEELRARYADPNHPVRIMSKPREAEQHQSPVLTASTSSEVAAKSTGMGPGTRHRRSLLQDSTKSDRTCSCVGPDSRRLVTSEAVKQGLTAIVQVVVDSADDTTPEAEDTIVAIGTGTMLGLSGRLVLTAASHVVNGHNSGTGFTHPVDDWRVYPGVSKNRKGKLYAPFGGMPVSYIEVFDGFYFDGWLSNFAILILVESFPTPPASMGYSPVCGEVKYTLAFAGYPLDRERKGFGLYRNLRPVALKTDICDFPIAFDLKYDAGPGQEGSPLWHVTPEGTYIRLMHSRTNYNRNNNTAITIDGTVAAWVDDVSFENFGPPLPSSDDPTTGGPFQIKSLKAMECLDSAKQRPNGRLNARPCHERKSQTYTVEAAGSAGGTTFYQIRASQGLCLTGAVAETNVLLKTCRGSDTTQQFVFTARTEKGSKGYEIRPRNSVVSDGDPLCVDLPINFIATGQDLDVYNCEDSASQLFFFYRFA